MSQLVTLVHPYTYKLKGPALVIGPIEEYRERDFRVAEFLLQALEKGTPVLRYRLQPANTLRETLETMAFRSDPLYDLLLDFRLKSAVIPAEGFPLPDEKPPTVTSEEWETLRTIYTSHSQLQQEVGNPQTVFFIGGMLENCVTTAAIYHHQFLRTNGQKMYYVPELCATRDEKRRKLCENELQQRKIHPLTFDQALPML